MRAIACIYMYASIIYIIFKADSDHQPPWTVIVWRHIGLLNLIFTNSSIFWLILYYNLFLTEIHEHEISTIGFIERNESWIIEEILKHYFQIMQNMLFLSFPCFHWIRNIKKFATSDVKLRWKTGWHGCGKNFSFANKDLVFLSFFRRHSTQRVVV